MLSEIKFLDVIVTVNIFKKSQKVQNQVFKNRNKNYFLSFYYLIWYLKESHKLYNENYYSYLLQAYEQQHGFTWLPMKEHEKWISNALMSTLNLYCEYFLLNYIDVN